eukprot:TRINITY_DN15421_c0_g1_i1.p2 TRINITY_DN15421_c0_g1~~TRINITY_DN15421_c0_g1_i1.p2  ORF type:complete len:186 (-),score=9.28 TRINITY_DN15421_c0_g1_i1:812-1324(-)
MAVCVLLITLSCFMGAGAERRSEALEVLQLDQSRDILDTQPFVDVPPEHRCQEESYADSSRSECDKHLKPLLEPLYSIDRTIQREHVYTSLEAAAFKRAWQCYAKDPCFMSVPGPSALEFSVSETHSSVTVTMGSKKKRFSYIHIRREVQMGNVCNELQMASFSRLARFA